MSLNQRNITNSIRVASIFKVVVTTALLAVAGLSYVYLKNQLHQYGAIQRRLEHDLVELRANNQVVRAQMDSLSSRLYIEKKLAKDSRGLVPIGTAQVVRLNQQHDSEDMRVVSNRGFSQ